MSNGSTVLPVRGASPYDVVVGHDLLDELPRMLGERVQRVAVIHPHALVAMAERVRERLVTAGFQPTMIELPDGEQAKEASVAVECWQALGQAGFTRSDAVVTVGGGSTTDMGGFVAASWLRGVKVIHMPTTLLAMVDAAVGGKTGMNTAEGKNLVGAFHEPGGVLCDLASLETLPREELVSGFAEVVKCGFIADPQILALVEADVADSLTVGSQRQRELVERAISVKIDVVVADLKEQGGVGGHPGREMLNYGHTLGHAIERVERYHFRHGAAISVGMVFVAELARLAGRLSCDVVARHRDLLGAVGLPITYVGGRWPELHDAMKVDKKTRGDLLRFVVLDDIAAPVVFEGPDLGLLTAAYAEISQA